MMKRRYITSTLPGEFVMEVFYLILTVLFYDVFASTTRPHIVVIVADDLGWNDVSFHGSTQIPTPNIDNLAYNGVILNNYYVSPICTPTRGALMSGRHPIHTGLQESVIVGSQPYGLPLNFTIMPEWLKGLGYQTHMIGKWHLGFFRKEYTPTQRGFDSHFGYYQGCGDYYGHSYEANEEQFGYDFWRNSTVDYTSIGQYSTDLFTNYAVNIIDQHDKTKPLFLYLPYQAVHSGNLPSGKPLQAPSSYIRRHPHIKNEQRRDFAGMMAALDDGVGHVVKALQKNGLYNNSIIMFTTDNGGPANGFDANAANNFPLRGVKATLWEGGVRGTGFIHSPILKKKGYVSEQLIHVCDWLPTLYSAAGGDVSKLGNLDGYDMWNMLSNNGKFVRSELLHNIDPSRYRAAIRVNDYKLLVGHINMKWDGWYPPYQLPDDTKNLHFTNENLKYNSYENFQGNSNSFARTFAHAYKQNPVYERTIHLGGSPVVVKCGNKPGNASTNCNPTVHPCLYHIPSDPCEYYNIAQSHPDIVNDMIKRLAKYERTMIPAGNKPFDPRGNPINNKGAWVPWQ